MLVDCCDINNNVWKFNLVFGFDFNCMTVIKIMTIN
jgi:hypothetical protein